MTILVTGATGNVGRQVVAGLVRAGRTVRAMTRKPQTGRLPAGEGLPGGAGCRDRCRHRGESARDPAPTNEEWAGVVPRLTGRPTQTFAQWATDHAADFR